MSPGDAIRAVRKARWRAVAAASLVAAALLLAGATGAQGFGYLPDPGFGSGGAVDLLAVNQAGGTFRRVADVEPGPDGSAWVLYRDLAQPEQYECEAQSSLARYLPYGSLDTAFGSDGFVPLYSPVGCTYASLAVDNQLRPLVSWTSEGGSKSPSTAAIARYTTAGALDPAFGSGGAVSLTIPCPGGNSLEPHAGAKGSLLLSFGCRENESIEEWPRYPFKSFFARLLANGTLDTSFGQRGFVVLPLEDGWEPPSVAAIEADGSAVLSQETRYAPDLPNQPRLLRLRPDGTFAGRYQARAEASLRRLARLAPSIPERAEAFVLRRGGDLVVGGRSGRSGWLATLRHDGSLEREFSGDGFRKFSKGVTFLASDRRGRLFVLGGQFASATIARILPDGNRDPSVGRPGGQRLALSSDGSLSEVVSFWHGLPLLYFTNLGSCSSPQDCAEPAGLQRLRLAVKKPRRWLERHLVPRRLPRRVALVGGALGFSKGLAEEGADRPGGFAAGTLADAEAFVGSPLGVIGEPGDEEPEDRQQNADSDYDSDNHLVVSPCVSSPRAFARGRRLYCRGAGPAAARARRARPLPGPFPHAPAPCSRAGRPPGDGRRPVR